MRKAIAIAVLGILLCSAPGFASSWDGWWGSTSTGGGAGDATLAGNNIWTGNNTYLQPLTIREGTAPGTPASGYGTLFMDSSDQHIYFIDYNGTTTDLMGSGVTDHNALTNKGTYLHTEIDAHIDATVAHGITGSVVGTTDVQTISNKTLNNVTITGKEVRPVKVVNAASYVTMSDDFMLHVIYTATGVCTITIMSAHVENGRMFHIKDAGFNAHTNNIIVQTEGAELIDGNASWTIDADGSAYGLYSDGTNWFIH